MKSSGFKNKKYNFPILSKLNISFRNIFNFINPVLSILNIRAVLVTISILVFHCAIHPPEKPDLPYVLLNSLIQPEDSDSSTTENPNLCPSSNVNFNPNAVVDTGQTQCWDSTGTNVPCAGTGQDGEFVNVPNQRSFSGPTQHCIYQNDYTTLDLIHGLTWKTCAQGLSGANCSGGVVTPISWNNASAGLTGSCAELNTLNSGNGYAGKTNWRIPTIRELASLVHTTNTPRIDTTAFPNTPTADAYISDTPLSLLPLQIYSTNFTDANPVINLPKTFSRNLRCVSGNSVSSPSFVDNGDGTVTDQNTNLVWQQCPAGVTGGTCAIGMANTLNWTAALNYCDTLNIGVRSNWRLPNVNELMSIVDYSAPGAPFTYTAFFPNTPVGVYFWSSTSVIPIGLGVPNVARVFGFSGINHGQSYGNIKAGGALNYVRCVTDFP
ncbi:DUF1566 domain-containing protein [Leptospira interrogans]|uniref:Lcl C-terminal domain-containing protein n=2 Tax=Leptospira interrogans TaxID=173 RepID=Q8F895_LEPIN|nr:DUF1566 domain-containing protein [Leptospira interrogans]AAN47862.2 hypothetical protein LA_0663 [Leptospira interrogans serovar Lai str. 56601]AER01350.1 hypothetical protein LIF_A0540 [Leptospira interrogans serovar Lai str. IPAV]ALE40916.1 hypothetical protein G436_3770 [Leptospira interrogans serovar Hardjo str. Norma]ALO01679.1 hypothetical protein LIH_15115 [Leptospira interrogans serovar Hardjo-prajitno]EKO94700.1 PF07603 family protein [Leptospira interrogans str. Brem 329]